MNSRQRIGQIVTLLVSALGAWVSILLMLIHGRTAAGDTEGAARLCGEGAQFDCSVAASSSYSELFGIPIAAIGFAFYVAVIVVGAMAKGEESKDESAPGVALLLFGGFALSLVYSIYLAVINATVLDKSCDKCLYLYLLNLVGYFATGYWAGTSTFDSLRKLFGQLGGLLKQPATMTFALTFAVALFGASWQTNKIKSGSDGSTPSAREILAEPKVDLDVLYRADAPSYGPADAPVQIVEFSDFECPYCARFAEVISALKDEFPTELRVTFRNYPLSFHPNARLVARGAVCANEQGNFWPFHDLAFARQASLSAPDFDIERIVTIAKDAGLNPDEMRDCVLSGFSEERVARDVADGQAVNLRGTPTVFINGTQYQGNLDLNSMRSVIRDIQAILAEPEAAE